MRFSILLLAGLSAFVSGQKDATEQLASMAADATAHEQAAISSMQARISSERAAQTLSGLAASQAAHNSQALASALSAISALQNTIGSAEASVLSVQKTAIATLSKQVATATGKWRALGRTALAVLMYFKRRRQGLLLETARQPDGKFQQHPLLRHCRRRRKQPTTDRLFLFRRRDW
jgi:hypothetical protein